MISNSQEQLGLKISNYSGINAVGLNPAWNVGSPLKWDVNIVSLGVFAHQNYMYGQKGSIVKLLNQGATFITDATENTADATTSTAVPFYFNTNKNFDAHHNAFVMVPSFMFQLKEHTFGFYIQGRSWMSGYNLDGDLNYHNLTDTLTFVGEFDPFQFGAMAWGEIGLNYGRNLRSDKNMDINFGGTVKLLLGYEGVSVSNFSSTQVTRIDDAISLDQANMGISYASNYTEEEGYDFQRNGFGMATDIGVTFVNKNAKQDKQHYKWKLGVSILDIGRLRYAKNANVYQYSSNEVSTFSTAPFEEITDADGIIDAVNASNNTSEAVLTDNKFGMWMPMALSVQFDAPMIDRLYISGTAVIGMRFKGAAIERSDIVAITPRFETKWFEIGIPVSLYRWQKLSLGTYLRMGPLTVGTEHLNSWVIPGKFQGSDIYLSLKINAAMFKKNNESRNSGAGCYSNKF